MKKALKWLAVAHLALIVIPLAVLLLANLRDEELTPAAAAFLQTERSSVPDEQNAFYYLVGFNAPLAEHPHAAGRAWLAAVNAAQEKILAGTEAPWPPQPRGLPKIEALCIPERDSCIRSLKEKDEGRKALAHHAQIVERYRAVHAYRGYFDMLDARLHSYPLPLYLQSSNAQRLFLMDVARRLEGGEIDRALAALRDEIAFTRRMLAGSRSLLQKMVAAGQLQRTAVFASDALAAYRRPIGRRAAMLAEALRPLSAEERRLMPALRSEFALAASASEPSRWRAEDVGIGVDTALLRPFYQHRASVNMIYELSRAWGEVDNAPAASLDAAFARAKAAEPQFSAWSAIYNPVGKLLFFANLPALSAYFERMHDTDVLVRMVALQAEIVARRIRPEGIAAFLQASTNPYTGRPYDWDAGTRQLSFEPRNRNVRDQKIGGVPNRVTISL